MSSKYKKTLSLSQGGENYEFGLGKAGTPSLHKRVTLVERIPSLNALNEAPRHSGVADNVSQASKFTTLSR